MTWRIIKQGWEGCDALSDTRIDAFYPYEQLNGAKYVTSNDVGEVCFSLVDGRIAWLVSTDLETVEPLHDPYLREPYVDDDTTFRYYVWWCAAGCLPDTDNPAFAANTIEEVNAWLASDEADEYRESTGEFNTYEFEIVTNLSSDNS